MTTRTQLEAERALKDYTRRNKKRLTTAALGNNAGTVDVTGRDDWVWCRLHGDANQVTMAYCGVSVPRLNNLVVAVEEIRRTGGSYYSVVSIATNIVYDGNDAGGIPGFHAFTHQRRDLGQGGPDPLDVYNRALVNLRARAQVPADMTLYVEIGWYFMAGTMGYWTGGSSPAFTAPGVAGMRADLLYIGTDYALHISAGTDYHYDGSLPDISAPVGAYIPIAVVYLTSATTAISETAIRDARVLLTASASTATAHALLSATHSDTTPAAVVEDDLIVGNFSPTWARLAKGGDGDVLTVNSTTHHVAWCSPQTAVLTVTEEDGVPSVANVTEIRVTNGALTNDGGGAVSIDVSGAAGAWGPADAEYVTTAASATLTQETAIPGFAAHADRLPAAPNAEDDEFDSGTLDAKWTEVTDAPSHDHNTTWPSHIYVDFTANQTYRITQDYAPAGNFSVTACFHYSFQGNSPQGAVIAWDDDESEGVMANFLYDSGYKGELGTRDASVWTYARSALTLAPASHFYVHLQRVTNTWSSWVSFDGLSFWRVGTYNKTFTVDHFEVQANQNGGTIPTRAGIDWVRRDWITL